MKHKITLLFGVAIMLLATAVFAQSTAENFEKWLPDMSSLDRQKKENSQQSWEKICMSTGAPGNEELRKEVNSLMTEQLDKDIPLDTKVWLLYQLRFTGDASVVPAVTKCLKDIQTRIRDEAARALAQNPSKEAEDALKTALSHADNELDKLRYEIALQSRHQTFAVPSETKMPMAIPYVSSEKVDEWMSAYDELDKTEKLRTLASLKVRKDKKYLPKVIEAVKGNDPELKTAGILALQTLGGTKEIPLLLENRFGDQWNITMNTIRFIVDDGFDVALLDALKKEKDNNRFFGIAEDLGVRNCKPALPTIIAFAKSPACDRRHDMLRAAERIADSKNIKDFIDVTLLIKDRGQRDEAEKVIARLCNNNGQPIISIMTKENSNELLSLLGRIGDDTSLAEVRKLLNDSELRPAAIRALSNWPNAKVYDDLIKIAQDNNQPLPVRTSTLRAAIRVITLPDNQVGIKISPKERIEALQNAMKLATRNEEKLLVLERAAAVRDPESVRFVLPYLDQDTFKERAAQTIVDIAHHDNVRRPNKQLFTEALDKVIETTKNTNLIDRARQYKSNL